MESIVWLTQKLVSVGWSLVRSIFMHPKTTKMIAFLALQVKKAICREVSIALGKYRYRKSKGLLETVQDGLKNAQEYATVILPDLISDFLKSPKFEALWVKLSDVLSSGVTSVVMLIPFAGALPAAGIAAGVVSTLMSVLKESCREATELAIYKLDITMTFGFVVDIFDPTNCISEQEVTEEEIEARKKSGLIKSFGDNVIPGIVDLTKV